MCHSNNHQLPFKIHHKHQHNQYHQLVHQAIQMQPDGICIHRFVSVIRNGIFIIFQTNSNNSLYFIIEQRHHHMENQNTVPIYLTRMIRNTHDLLLVKNNLHQDIQFIRLKLFQLSRIKYSFSTSLSSPKSTTNIFRTFQLKIQLLETWDNLSRTNIINK